jgi:polygalacturonase
MNIKKTTLHPAICLCLVFTLQTIVFAQSIHKKENSQVVTYPAPPGLETSTDFAVKVNNKNVWTESIGNGGMENLNVANYSASGVQTITITASSAIKKYMILPKSRSIIGHVNGRELTFTITSPQKLYIEINNLPHLAIFSNPIEVNVPKENDPNIVYYEPGTTHTEKEITLKSNQTIYIAGGAVVNANIRGKNLQNVKIIGRGILNGNVRISGTSNLEVNGIFIRNTAGWCNTLIDCHNTIYKNVKVFSYKTVWGIDGIDPVSCKNFTIDDCFIRTRDDCVSIKSVLNHGRDTVKDINTDSITVKNSVLMGWSHADGVTMGFELQGGLVQNVLVKNCDILSARGQGRTGGHSAFSIVCDGPSVVQNIRFEDIRIENAIEYKNLELIVTEGRRYGTAGPGQINGVYLKNIHWANTDKPFVIAGIPTNFVENITFDHCYLAGKALTNTNDADFQIEFAKSIKFIPATSTTN